MITCPWCGTNYEVFQSNCGNCGGSLPRPAEGPAEPSAEGLVAPPPPPRDVPDNHIWRLFLTDGWVVAAGVFFLLGFIFAIVGIALTVSLVAAFVGLPFVCLGMLFLALGLPVLVWRYSNAQRIVDVLREGEPVLGRIVHVRENVHVQVNGRYPWTIVYRFTVGGQEREGKVTTLSRPGLEQRPGRPAYVLYMQDDPEQNVIYPSPYGYYGL
jgi:membrane protein implicated in regulation of membrane protease activity